MPYAFLFVLLVMNNRRNMKDSTFKHFNPMKLREKYSAKNRTNNYSSFWMDSDWDTRNTSIFDDDEVEVNTKPKTDLVALAGYRRAIANFVTIVTGESDIKVIFNSNDDSYTDNGYSNTLKHINYLFMNNKISLLTKSQLVNKITSLQEMPKRLRKWAMKIN